MICHECFGAAEEQRPAVGLCTFCSIALCWDHLEEAVLAAPVTPRYACQHTPGRLPVARRAAVAPRRQPPLRLAVRG